MRWALVGCMAGALGMTAVVACTGTTDDAAVDTDAATGTGATAATVETTAAGTNADDDGLDATAGETTAGNPSGTGTAADSTAADDGPPPPDPFLFDDTPVEQYVQQDRAGLAGASTLLVLLGDKDAYNGSTPAFDAQGAAPGPAWELVYAEAMDTLHHGVPGMQTDGNTGLHDDLIAEGYGPCIAPQESNDTCFNQIIGLAVPDVLALTLDAAAAFPNGRRLDTPVMDLMLARLLLNLQTQPPDLFVDMDEDGIPGPSLNPIANDVAFSPFFPHLAPPHR